MKVLILEDERDVALLLSVFVRQVGHQVIIGHNMGEGLRLIETENPHAALLDVELPDGSGIDLLRQVRLSRPDFPAAMVTGSTDVDTVVEAMKAGAIDYMTKPVDQSRLQVTLINLERLSRLQAEVSELREAVTPVTMFEGIVGASIPMQGIYRIIRNVARSSATVMITGESGVGKELVAQAIHARSQRATAPIVEVNCAAVNSGVLESELFGHEKGAFTTALRRHQGCFERAHRGTLFLDEICEMDLQLQAKLLRVLQDQAFYRVGGSEKIQVDVRIVAATNKDPLKMVRDGKFRQDLYYRLNVVPIMVPSLRERREDIPLLVRYFLASLRNQNARGPKKVDITAMTTFCAYDWQGNVRELRNIMEQIAVLNDGDTVTTDMIPDHLRGTKASEEANRIAENSEGDGQNGSLPGNDKIEPMWAVEKREISRALTVCGGNIRDVSRKLQISQATLYRKISKYKLR